MRRILVLITALALVLGGCAVSSKLPEYKTETERLHAELVEQLPDGITASEPSITSEAGYGTESGRGDTASSPAYWQITDLRNLIDEAGSSERAFTALSQHLTENGWTYRRVRGDDESGDVADGFRRTDQDDASWYVEVRWAKAAPDMAETLDIVIVSPMTTRGQEAPENTP
ncbi:MAG: hypothetical protein ACTMIR_07875 [Cellulomonadaceae bacterium]